jgi:hypothetical protein
MFARSDHPAVLVSVVCSPPLDVFLFCLCACVSTVFVRAQGLLHQRRYSHISWSRLMISCYLGKAFEPSTLQIRQNQRSSGMTGNNYIFRLYTKASSPVLLFFIFMGHLGHSLVFQISGCYARG